MASVFSLSILASACATPLISASSCLASAILSFCASICFCIEIRVSASVASACSLCSFSRAESSFCSAARLPSKTCTLLAACCVFGLNSPYNVAGSKRPISSSCSRFSTCANTSSSSSISLLALSTSDSAKAFVKSSNAFCCSSNVLIFSRNAGFKSSIALSTWPIASAFSSKMMLAPSSRFLNSF